MADILQQCFRKTTTFTNISVKFLQMYLKSIRITHSLSLCSPKPPNLGFHPPHTHTSKKNPTTWGFHPYVAICTPLPKFYATVYINFMLGVPAPPASPNFNSCENTIKLTVPRATEQTLCYNYQSKSTISHVIHVERKMHDLVQMSVNWSIWHPLCSVAYLMRSTPTPQSNLPTNTVRSYISKELNLWTFTVLYFSPVRTVRKHIRINKMAKSRAAGLRNILVWLNLTTIGKLENILHRYHGLQ